jgi:hypothetical protein
MTREDRLTPEEIAAIRERAEKATPGPWTWLYGLRNKLFTPVALFHDGKIVGRFVWEHDAEFIAHAREDIPRLLDALEATYAEIERLQRKLNAMDDAVYARFGYCEQQNVWADINERLGEEDYE